MHALVLDVDARNTTIRVFGPEIDVQIVRVRPTPRRGGAQPGDNARIVLNLLQTGGQKTSRELLEAVVATRAMSRADRKLYL